MRRIIFIAILFIYFVSSAQQPSKFFTRFGGSGIDIAYGVKETYNRQYIVIGSTSSYGNGFTDAYLSLVDSMGQITWSKTFGGSMADVGKNVIVSSVDSGFVFAGFTASFGNGGYDFYIVRTDQNGNQIWQTAYGGFDWDFARDLTFAVDGNIIICGETYSSGRGNKDGKIIKLDFNNGNLIWDKTFGGQEDDELIVIKNTSDGYYSLCGNTKSYGDLNNDFWLFKINNQGDSISSLSFGNSNRGEKCYDFLEDHQNNLIFCGSYDTSYYNSGKNISYTIKTDINGAYIQENKISYPGMKDDKFLAVANLKNANEYCFSRKVDHPGLEVDIQSIILNSNLIFINATTHGDLRNDEANDIIATSDNGFMMAGYSIGPIGEVEQVCLVKLDSTIVGAPSIVAVQELNFPVEVDKIYYYNGTIFFKNLKRESLDYQIFNLEGKVVQAGKSQDDFITLDNNLIDGIYFVNIGGNRKTKFVSQK